MFKNYFKTAIRNLKKNRVFTFISVMGLAIGTGAFIVLMNYADLENNFDGFQKDKNKIYRVESFFSKNGDVTDSWVTSSFGYAAAMQKEFPEVKSSVRVSNQDCERMVRYNNIIYREPRVVVVDSNFFTFFSYKLVQGDPEKVLQQPNTIVLSVSAAKKYFGNENAVGKLLDISTQQTQYHCKVTGVFEDFPLQSHIHFDLMISFSSVSKFQNETWYTHEVYTYVKVDSKSEAVSVEKKFPQLAEKYKTALAMKEKVWGVHLVPLSSIHLNTFKPYELEQKGSRTAVNSIIIIACIILVVGWINFINTLISKAMERAGEISVRKIAGATSRDIMMQFFAESLLINVIALLLFFIFIFTFKPLFENLYGETIFYHFWQRPLVWELIVFTFFAGIFITSFIPLIILKGVNTAAVLKNKNSFNGGMGKAPRLALIVFQYFAAMVLIIATATVHKQLNYMRSMDLGISTSQTLVFKTPVKTANFDEKLQGLMQNIKGFSDVQAVTMSSSVPGRTEAFVIANTRDNDPLKTSLLCDMIRVDPEFIPAYHLTLLKGRNFIQGDSSDIKSAVILTQHTLHLFGFKDEEDAVHGAVNLESFGNKKFAVIGLVKDFHQISPKEKFSPVVLTMFNPWNSLDINFVSVKLNGKSSNEIISATEQQFKSIFPGSSFDSFFLDDFFNNQYRNDQKYGSIITVFTWLALMIVCLGIFGLSGYMLIKRNKEIAIRKIIGADVFQILKLLNIDFIKCIVIAFLIATPVAWYAMNNWLQSFSNRTTISWSVFLIAALTTFIITLITVSALAFKTVFANPAESLRAE